MSNGQDLDGTYAFDKVLELLMDEKGKNSRDEGALGEARHATNLALGQQGILEKQIKKLEGDAAKALPFLSELHGAAQGCLPYIGAAESPSATAAYERLKKAIAEAATYCDEIPF